MKKILSVAMLVGALLFGMTYAADVFATEEEKSVDIMFLHDTHSHLNEFATVEDGKTQVLGGFAKLKTLINEQKEENPDTLILDAGDFAMGTLVQVMYEEEASELRMLGELEVEVTTFGNHEYDYKAEGLANMLNAAVTSGDVLPAIAVCNVDWETMESQGLTEEQQLLKKAFESSNVKDYVVTEKNGVKIAVIGVFGEDALDCVVDPPLLFENPVEAVKETVEEIKISEDVDMIACVSHCGTWADAEKSEDELIAKAVPEVDLIISGHTHTKLDEPIVHGDTYIVSASEYGKYLGDMSFVQKADGRWELENYDLILVDEPIEKDPATQEKVDGFMKNVDEKYLAQFGFTKDQVLAYNEYDFATSQEVGELHTELNLGSIMADAYTYAVQAMSDEDSHPVDVAVVPAGTIRDTYAKGNITTENVFNSFSLGIGKDGIPGYPLISVYLTGEELKLIAEIDSSISDLMTTARLYTDGLYWEYNPHRLILNKATDIYICDQNEQRVEIEDDKLYRVVTDFYSSQMLAGVTDLSYGLLKLEPKFADGTPIENYEDAIVMAGDQELKAWVAIAEYMDSFEDTDGDGVGEVPAKYDIKEGRKVVDDSNSFFKKINHLNKFTFLIIAALCLVILVLVIIVLGFWTIVKKIIHKCRKK